LASAVLASLFYTLVLRMSPSPGTDPPGYALASLDMSCLVTQDGGEFSRGGFFLLGCVRLHVRTKGPPCDFLPFRLWYSCLSSCDSVDSSIAMRLPLRL